MGALPPTTLTPFSNLAKGTYEFDDAELQQLAEMANKVKSIIDVANKRKQERIASSLDPLKPTH